MPEDVYRVKLAVSYLPLHNEAGLHPSYQMSVHCVLWIGKCLLGTPVQSNVIQYNSSAIMYTFMMPIMFSLFFLDSHRGVD